jgi:hypothetical protein
VPLRDWLKLYVPSTHCAVAPAGALLTDSGLQTVLPTELTYVPFVQLVATLATGVGADTAAGWCGGGVAVGVEVGSGVLVDFGVGAEVGAGVEVGATLAANTEVLATALGAGFPLPPLLLAAAETPQIASRAIMAVATLCRPIQFFFVLFS